MEGMKRFRKSFLLLAALTVAGLVLAGCSTTAPQTPNTGSSGAGGEKASLKGVEAVIYKSSSCGCCNLYASYLEKKGFKVQMVQKDDLTPVKEEFGVPSNLRSCHTVKLGNYFVEGHVPVEVIEKLLADEPDVDGIAMPGMPSGSPGMPGSKTGPFVIYSVKDGSYQEFARV